MDWYISYLNDESEQHKTMVRDVYLWAKKNKKIKRFPRKLKKAAYYKEPNHTKYINIIRDFVYTYYHSYLKD
jgi:hypothetical protein